MYLNEIVISELICENYRGSQRVNDLRKDTINLKTI